MIWIFLKEKCQGIKKILCIYLNSLEKQSTNQFIHISSHLISINSKTNIWYYLLFSFKSVLSSNRDKSSRFI